MITIFTDGASKGNPGPGGWGAVVVDDGNVIELGGGEKNTTNNRMEIRAAIGGLKKTQDGSDVTLYTDSSYLINGITKWIRGWKRNGWITKAHEEVLNRDLWEELHELAEFRNVKWKYVGGHVGIKGNERCDEIATAFADGKKVKLYKGSLGDYPIKGILDISHDAGLMTAKKSSSSRSRAAAYSYVSMVNRKVQTHKTWAECEKRVKGVRGARFKKALSSGDEASIIKEFTSKNS